MITGFFSNESPMRFHASTCGAMAPFEILATCLIRSASWQKPLLFTADQTSFLLIMKHSLYLPVENFNLTPAHACRPISHAWLKNVSCCHLAWHNFQKYVNSDPCKERKPCVKWLNDNTFLVISDFWSEKHWERAYTRPKTGTGTSEDFRLLRKTSDFFWNPRKWSSHLQNPSALWKKSRAYISEKVGKSNSLTLNIGQTDWTQSPKISKEGQDKFSLLGFCTSQHWITIELMIKNCWVNQQRSRPDSPDRFTSSANRKCLSSCFACSSGSE